MTDIKPVSESKISDTCRYIVSGDRRLSRIQHQQAIALEKLLNGSRGRKSRIYGAFCGKNMQAAAMVVVSEGHVGFLYYSPPDVPGIDPKALCELVDRIVSDSLSDGIPIVQAFVDPAMTGDIDLLSRAGMKSVATLVDLQSDLTDLSTWRTEDSTGFSLASAEEFGFDRLKAIITSTYQDSHDCPALHGARDIDAVLQSHRCTGIYTPSWWYVAILDGEPAGCILVNMLPGDQECRLVYVGVVPEHRGKGVASRMMSLVASVVTSANVSLMRVAVDASNEPAMKLYTRFKFGQLHARNVLVKLST